jgi:hypothetical protein
VARVALLIGLLSLLSPSARAQPAGIAAELAGLFLHGCLPFAGDPVRLRAWATGLQLRALPDPARSTFLNGAPGLVFDASTTVGKLVLVSSDDGLCSSVTGTAQDRPVREALETALRDAGITFRLVIDRDDRRAPELHYREYLAARDGRVWRILAATVKAGAGGQAMLTAGLGAAAEP